MILQNQTSTNMKKQILLLAISIFISVKSNAQSSLYEKAFYITLNDDTIHGYIRQDNDYSLINDAVFKNTLESKEQINLLPTSTKKFVIENGRTFERLELTHKKGETLITNYTFGKTLAKGICNFYNISKTRFDEDKAFAIEKDCRVYVLKQENHFYVDEEGHIDYDKKVIDYHYLGILKALVSDCDSLKNLGKVQLDETALLTVVQKYNKCKDIKSYTSVCKPIETFHITNRIQTKHLIYLDLLTLKKEKVVNLKQAIGCGYSYNTFNPDKIRLMSFSCGLQFLYMNYEFNVVYRYYSYNTLAQKAFISIPLTMNIHFYKRQNIMIYTSLGINPNYCRALKITNGYEYWGDQKITIMSKFAVNSNAFDISGIGGIGIIYKHAFLHIYYETPSICHLSLGYCF